MSGTSWRPSLPLFLLSELLRPIQPPGHPSNPQPHLVTASSLTHFFVSVPAAAAAGAIHRPFGPVQPAGQRWQLPHQPACQQPVCAHCSGQPSPVGQPCQDLWPPGWPGWAAGEHPDLACGLHLHPGNCNPLAGSMQATSCCCGGCIFILVPLQSCGWDHAVVL